MPTSDLVGSRMAWLGNLNRKKKVLVLSSDCALNQHYSKSSRPTVDCLLPSGWLLVVSLVFLQEKPKCGSSPEIHPGGQRPIHWS
ncbi:hypothetical protein AVEN_213044-1 [Araneus ventricosus]|uniref:Uncharacterized protein n=1 Tax=Araneus ventricosus TaxID=182803 RepID=A0A4Y2VQF8_ARAVE|nr:hypothetical protein AVEN_213044-1 [Araneus ventricosus]